MDEQKSGHSPTEEQKEEPNQILGISAILIGVAIVAMLIGGVVYWLIAPSESPWADAPVPTIFRGTPADRIELSPGAMKDWNVLLISTDTMRADRVGCYGNQQIETPAIDDLARRGIQFRRAFTPVPITLPAHTSMLSGLNPPRHGVRSNGLFRLSKDVKTLGSLLKNHGYKTGATIGAYVLDRKFGLGQGFDDYNDDLSKGHSPMQFGYRERNAGSVNDAAIPWIRGHAKDKFFCFVHYFDPHFPYRPPAPFDQQYKTNPYDGEIAYVDTQVARLVAVLDELDIRKRTLVIFTSDHGEALGEHYERTHALLIYDATQHVPLIISAPSPLPQNRIVGRNVGLIDIVPTVLSLLGAPIPQDLDGVSLLDRPGPDERSIYLETLYPKITHNWAPLLGIRRGDYKFIYAPQPEIYNLRKDPRELSNLYDSRRALATELYGQLKVMLGGDPATAGNVQGNLVVDAKTREMLKGLGYVIPSSTTSRATTKTASLPDPKVLIRVKKHMVNAQNLSMKGRYKEAAQQIERYLEMSPDDPEGTQIAGTLYRRLGRLDESLKSYRKAATLGYEPAEAWSGIGSIFVLRKKLDKAAEAYKKALEFDASSTTALIGMGSILSAQDKPEEAMVMFQTALKRGQGINAGMIYLGISNIHRRAGRTKEAEDALAKAVLAEPTNPVLAKVAAQYSESTGNVEQAIERLRSAADATPTTEVLLQLGRLLVKQKRHKEAVGYFQKGTKLDAESVELHYELGVALLQLNQIKEAAQALSDAHRLDPNHAPSLMQLGILFGQAGQIEQSEKILRRAVQADPKLDRGHYNLALVLIHLKKYDEAARELGTAIEINPRHPTFRTKLGIVFSRQGKKAQAIEQYRKALEIDADNAEAIKLLKEAGGGS